MKKITVYTENDNRDFAPWTNEKIGKALASLCLMISNDEKIKENSDFRCALSYTLMIYAYFNGALNKIYCEMVEELLLNFGYEGFSYLEDLINGTTNSTILKQKQLAEIEKETFLNIVQLINENKLINRTIIAQELNKVYGTSNICIKKIKDDIEFVHQGERTWEWFYLKHCNDKYIDEKVLEPFLREIYDYFKE